MVVDFTTIQNLKSLPTAARVINDKKDLLIATFDGQILTAEDYKFKKLQSLAEDAK